MASDVWYDRYYNKRNYFGYREWPADLICQVLISMVDLVAGSSVLDVGCGQGFFSYLLQKCGMKVFGLDMSEVGIHLAKRTYGSFGIEFIVGDAKKLPFLQKFDCVFSRSLSLYNRDDFRLNCSVTDRLFESVKDNGFLIFLYNTNFSYSKKSISWRYHTLQDVKQHFSHYSSPKIFFVSKIDTLILRSYAFGCISTKLNSFISRNFGLGGDIVCILRKE